MKPAILVTSHPNTDKKEQILKDFGNFISQYGIDHYLFTNYPANKDTQLEFKESHFCNYNPLGPNTGFVWNLFSEFNLKHKRYIPNWCYSGTHLILEGVKYLKHLGYTHVILLMYDTELNYPKIKSYIENSLEILKDKKGVFYEYDVPEWSNSLSTTQCACEVDFFLNAFIKSQKKYLNQKTPTLCEGYWYDTLLQFNNEVEILDKAHTLKTLYNSVEQTQTKIDNISCFIGGLEEGKKVGIILDSHFSVEFKIIDNNKNVIPYERIIDISRELIKFNVKENTSYFIQYKDQEELLFSNSLTWMETNIFEYSDNE